VSDDRQSVQFRDLIKHVLTQTLKKHSHELEYLSDDNREKLIFVVDTLMLHRFDLLEIISNDDEFFFDI
jgi:hypothetical protein